MTHDDENPDDDMILVSDHMDVSLHVSSEVPVGSVGFVCVGNNYNPTCHSGHLTEPLLSRVLSNLKSHLSPPPKIAPEPSLTHSPLKRNASEIQQGFTQPEAQPRPFDDVFFVSHGPFGIVDLGASQTVIGSDQVPELLSHLPPSVKSRVQKVACNTIFRFGNSSTVECREALMVPLDRWFVKICVVQSKTLFLVSNNVFRTLGAQIDTAADVVNFTQIQVKMPLTLAAKKLYLIDFCELVRPASQTPAVKSELIKGQPQETMHVEEESKSVGDEPQPSVINPCSSQPPSDPKKCSTDSNPSFCDHGLQPSCRTIPAGDIPEGQRRVHEDVIRPVVKDENRFRRGQVESEIHRCGDPRPKIHHVVCEEAQGISETCSSGVPVLQQSVCGGWS